MIIVSRDKNSYPKPGSTGEKSVCAVIPVYNNAHSIRGVAQNTLRQIPNLLILDDGSTDADLKCLLEDLPLYYFRQYPNRGKGAALRQALQILADSGFDYMLTLDADGQQAPSDIPSFLKLAESGKNIFAVGCRDFSGQPVPYGSRIGRKLSNWLLKWECGIHSADSQSGFRMYPVRLLTDRSFRGEHFDFETEVMAAAAGKGADFHDLPVKVYYPPGNKRVTHFRPLPELSRLSLLHLRLLTKRLFRKRNQDRSRSSIQ